MKRYRRLGALDWVVIISGVILILVISYFLTGCAKTQKLSDFDVLWSDGKCIFHAKGMTIEQAQNLQKEWKFDNCDVQIETSDSTSGKGVKEQ
jgi:hypothetical protein